MCLGGGRLRYGLDGHELFVTGGCSFHRPSQMPPGFTHILGLQSRSAQAYKTYGFLTGTLHERPALKARPPFR